MEKQRKTALHYILESMIPFTEANLKLTFSPHRFFNDLESIERQKYRHATLRSAYYKARQEGLIVFDKQGIPRLTDKGRSHITPYIPQTLPNGAQLIVAFDIPESDRAKRNRLRTLLKELKFTQVQKSLWVSDKDYREYLHAEIETSNLQDQVRVYEALRLL